MGKKVLTGKTITLTGDFGPNRRKDQWKKWVEAAGGTFTATLTPSPTHLVASEEHWKGQVKVVQDALARKDVKVVHVDWLENILMRQKRERETKYLWTTIDAANMKARKLQDKMDARAAKEAEKRQSKNLVLAALQDHTSELLGDKERKALSKKLEDEEKEKQKQKQIERQLGRKRKRDEKRDGVAKGVFERGVEKAKRDGLGDNHHVYTDSTGFRYDVVLTKVDTGTNQNERCSVTIYESNATPHTYATHVRTSGTATMATSLTTASLGSNYPTAFREFRKVFKEKTGVEWDQRLVAFDKVVGTHTASAVSAANGSGGTADTIGMSKDKKRKTNVEEESLERDGLEKERQERAWKEMKFIYTPPVGNAPKGVLPHGANVSQTLQSTEGDSIGDVNQGRGVSEGLAGGTSGLVGGMSPHVGDQEFAMSGGLGFAVQGQAQEGAMQWGQSAPAIDYDTAAGQGSGSMGMMTGLGPERFGIDGQAMGGAASNGQENFGIPVPGFESQGYFQDAEGQVLQPPLLNLGNLENLENLEGELDPGFAGLFPEFDGKVSEEFMIGLAEHAGR